MKKIIKLALPTNHVLFDDIKQVYDIPKDQLIALLTPYPDVFVIGEFGIDYFPPYNITDKKSLQTSIDNAFPRGIRFSTLQLCYEFAESDCNRIIYENGAFVIPFGKTNEKLVYKKYEPKISIRTLWDRSMSRLQPYPTLFQPTTN